MSLFFLLTWLSGGKKVLTLINLSLRWVGPRSDREEFARKSARSGGFINHLSDDRALVRLKTNLAWVNEEEDEQQDEETQSGPRTSHSHGGTTSQDLS